MTSKVTKAVFPVAGMGTRFLPATKANPKEMLPIVDKPLIQFAAEEAVEAGLKELIFINGRNKRSIPDHFDKAYELERELEERGKIELLKKVQNILPSDVSCIYIRQSEALGLGHAVGCARPITGNEAFAVILADDLIVNSGKGVLRQMVEAYEATQCSILGVEEVDPSETSHYGIVHPEQEQKKYHSDSSINDRLVGLDGMVEKPTPDQAPSNLAVVGRYVLTPRVMHLLDLVERGAGGEIQLTDAIAMAMKFETVLAYRFHGKRYDCGSKLGYLMASVEMGLKHDELGEEFRDYLQHLKF
jgi:UTP--glucose-1-phosphate uridylyltransferase